jgi:hypothetical protein
MKNAPRTMHAIPSTDICAVDHIEAGHDTSHATTMQCIGDNRISAPTSVDISVILPVIDETDSLGKTIDILLAENSAVIEEMLIVVYGKTTPAALTVCSVLEQQHRDLISVRR